MFRWGWRVDKGRSRRYQSADCNTRCDGGNGTCAGVARDAAAGCEGGEEEGLGGRVVLG